MPARILGALLVASTPITGILSFAALAIVFGEERFEDAAGLTALGWLAVLLPALAGALVIATSIVKPDAFTAQAVTSRRKIVALTIALAVVASLAIGLGAISIRSSATDGDASIGGGLLVLAGMTLAGSMVVLGVVSLSIDRNRS